MTFNIFKKEKEVKNTDQTPKGENVTQGGNLAGITDFSLILRGPHVTEKSGFLNGFNQYVFKVSARSNKIEIKKAVEKMYRVKVDRVMISVIPSKKRRLGQQEGERSGFKKAIVKLAAGHKIDVVSK